MVTITLDAASVDLGRRRILDGIAARFEPGALVGIIGPNGAGKSTLLRAMLGLIPLAHGAIMLDGATLGSLSRREIARRLAYLPQGQTLHWPLTVERLVALGRLPHLGPLSRLTQADADAIEAALARGDVLALRNRVATELSGGERARVMLARMLAVEAPALLVDEPLASLDPGHQIDVMTLLRREAADGALVLAVLHDLGMAARFCDRLLLLDAGRIVADGPADAVLTADRLAAVYGITAEAFDTGAGRAIIPLARVAAASAREPRS
jgi:iron complex transport system ATP-binding protein